MKAGDAKHAAYYIGIDPGKRGGIVLLDSLGDVLAARAADQDFRWWHRTARGHPADRMAGLLRHLIAIACVRTTETRLGALPTSRILVAVEQQWSKGREGGNAKQIREQGIWEGLAAMAARLEETIDLELITVASGTWRKQTGTSRGVKAQNKAASILYCRSRLPTLDLCPGQRVTPHDGLADAAVIADWLRRRDLKREE